METPIDARSLPPGTRLGRFALGSRIARGGMAELYLARTDTGDGFEKLVALKLVLPQYKDDAVFLEMLRNEARLVAALEHPNIASVYDLSSDRGEHFIAMEYVHGRNVAEILDRADGPLPLACALALVGPACEAAHHAHDSTDARGRAQALIHRDISPSNVLVRYDGVVKLVDFGIAKATAHTRATHTGTVKGKMGYMSPEQCLGGDLDRRTDVFALGVLLYELTTGRRLFVGGSDFAIMNAIISGEYVRPSAVDEHYPEALEGIIVRALASDRENRFPSARAFRSALLEFETSHGIDTSPTVLADWMAAHFDVPATPVVTAETLAVVELGRGGGAGPGRGFGRAVLPYVAVAAAAGLVGFFYAPVDAPQAAPDNVRPAQVDAPGRSPAAVAAPVAAPRTQPDPVLPVAAEPEPGPTPDVSVEAVPVTPPAPLPAAEAKPAPVRKHRRKSKPRPDSPAKATKSDSSLLPPSLRSQ